MLKLINHSNFTSQASDPLRVLATKSVQRVLELKPSGLSEIEQQLSESKQWVELLKEFKNKHSKFYLIGIGGSSLGVQVLAEVFQKTNFHFIDNVDAEHLESQLNSISNLEDVGWLVVSKSGRTIETLMAFDLVQQIYQEKNIPIEKHSLVITEKKDSDLYNWARAHQVPVFPIPLTVGGRYSVLTSVGLVPAILMGLDCEKISQGAALVLKDEKTLAQATENALRSFSRNEWVTVLWCYSSRLRNFGLWWQQLWAESLAKKQNRNNEKAPRVSTPLPLIGATDQHSVLQQIVDGEKDKYTIFLRAGTAEEGRILIKNPTFSETAHLKGKKTGALLRAEADATQLALRENNISQMTLFTHDLGEESIAYMFMFFQLLVMSIGEALNINAFDQPGVEMGKKITKEILSGHKSYSDLMRG